MREIQLKSPAKINWRLHVGGLRSDGFHGLETIYQALDFSDEITVRVREDEQCVLSGFPSDIEPAHNLVYKAWAACRGAFEGKVGGIDIEIKKVLPRGGGLGGGSSNGGTVIRAIGELFGLGDIEDADYVRRLQGIAASIGSDVPFFIQDGTARGTGRGEIIHQLPPSPAYWLVLVMPQEGVSTAEAYRVLDELPREEAGFGAAMAELEGFAEALQSGDPRLVAGLIVNDFELVAARHEWFRHAKAQLERAGALRAFLCGSGSTVAGLCADRASAEKVAGQISGSVMTLTT